MSSTRQLAAILFTDIAGYTAMMQKDEAAALAVVRKYTAVLVETVASYHGAIVNDYGDGNLCTFASATEAIRCALELQRRLQTEPQVPLRVGLHIGEVIFENEKPFGDGVNVASRIQSLGVANSILFSAEIYSKISNQAEFSTISLGTFSFKNVIAPMEVFALANEGLVVPARANMEGKLEAKGNTVDESSRAIQELSGDRSKRRKQLLSAGSLILLVLTVFILLNYEKWLPEPEEKSIAVLPFKNLSADPKDQYLADGFYEEIIGLLSKQRNLLVINQSSSNQVAAAGLTPLEISKKLNVQYLLSGSVRKEGDDLRITTRLEDAVTGVIVNTKTLDRKIGDYFNVQAEVALRVVRDVGITVSKGLLSPPSTSNLKAFEYYGQAHKYPLVSPNKETQEKRLSFLKLALKEDSMYLVAWLGLIEYHLFWYGNPGGDSTNLAAALHTKMKIESIDKDSYISKNANMLYAYWVLRDYDLVIKEADEFLKIIPNGGSAMSRKGLAYRRLGRYQEFLETFFQLQKRNPLASGTKREMALTLGGHGQTRDARKYLADLKNSILTEDYYMIAYNCLILENRMSRLDSLLGEVDKEPKEKLSDNIKRDLRQRVSMTTSFYNRDYAAALAGGRGPLDSALLYRLSGDSSRSRELFIRAKELYGGQAEKPANPDIAKTSKLNYGVALAALGEPDWEKVFTSSREGFPLMFLADFYLDHVIACLLAGRKQDAMKLLTEWKERNIGSVWGNYIVPWSQLLKNHPLLDPLRSEPGFEDLWEGNHLKIKPLKVPQD